MALLTTKDKAYLTIDAGGTYIKSAVLDGDGTVLEDSFLKTKSFSDNPKEVILSAFSDTVIHGLEIVLSEKRHLGGIGIAFPGPFDYKNGIPLMEQKFQSLHGLPLKEILSENLGEYQNVPLVFVHDANATLEGELWRGNVQSYNNVAVITLGTGIGFALSENRKVLCNELGSPLVKIFNIKYGDGILEDVVSRKGILEIFKSFSDDNYSNRWDVDRIGALADNGHVPGILTFKKVGEILSDVLKNTLIERRIQCLLFGGQISKSFQHIEQSLKQGLKEINFLEKVSVVHNIDNSTFYGLLHRLIQ